LTDKRRCAVVYSFGFAGLSAESVILTAPGRSRYRRASSASIAHAGWSFSPAGEADLPARRKVLRAITLEVSLNTPAIPRHPSPMRPVRL
jgi:hypothetical protein